VTSVYRSLRRTAAHLRQRLRPSDLDRRAAALDVVSGDLAIDCGANVGEVTVRLAEAGAEVHAFEPNPAAFAVLERRAGACSDIHLHPQAVLDRNGRVRLYLHRNAGEDPVRWSNGSSLLPFKSNVDPEKYIEVDAVDLGQFVLDLERPVKVVKIDVEGAECPIVERLIESAAIERIDTVVVEMHDARIPEVHDDAESLRRRIEAERLSDTIRLDWI
jgi:FkbM family methyltransferase